LTCIWWNPTARMPSGKRRWPLGDGRTQQPVALTVADLPVPLNSRFIGECIYCGLTSDLSTEHAVPYAINGPWTLLEASCKACRDITHRFEHDTIRGVFPALRAVFRMQTRRKKDRPKTLPLVVESRGQQRVIQLPTNEYPLYLPVIEFPPPGVVDGRQATAGMARPVLNFTHLAGPSFENVARQHPDAEFLGARLSFAPDALGRTLAKIGFCAAVFALGIAPFQSTPVRDVILGRDPCIGHWVGSWTGDQQNPPKGLHAMKVRAAGTDIHVILRLFAQFGAPEYHVALGPAAPEFVNSAEWPWR
jgi:hypothetical protein